MAFFVLVLSSLEPDHSLLHEVDCYHCLTPHISSFKIKCQNHHHPFPNSPKCSFSSNTSSMTFSSTIFFSSRTVCNTKIFCRSAGVIEGITGWIEMCSITSCEDRSRYTVFPPLYAHLCNSKLNNLWGDLFWGWPPFRVATWWRLQHQHRYYCLKSPLQNCGFISLK